MKFISSSSYITVASFFASNVTAKYRKHFSDKKYIHRPWLKCTPVLFEDFKSKKNIIQRIKNMPLAKNMVKDKILKMTKSITYQQKIDIKSCVLISLCLDEYWLTGSTYLTVFTCYCVGNNIKEELICLTSLATRTKGIDIYSTAVNEFAETKKFFSKFYQ